VTDETRDGRHISAGIEQIRDERAAQVMRAERFDPCLNPTLLERVVYRLVGQPPLSDMASLVDRAE
jgi:hypothetical protein